MDVTSTPQKAQVLVFGSAGSASPVSSSPVIDEGYASSSTSPSISKHDSPSFDNSLYADSSSDSLLLSPTTARRVSDRLDPVSSIQLAVATHQQSDRAATIDSTFWDWLLGWTPFWLALYFCFNLSLTIYNKIALVSFPYPWALTSIHSLCASCGCIAAYRLGYFEFGPALAFQEKVVLFAFSGLYTINIAVSNLSLNLVSVPVHQVVRATVPLFALILTIILYRKRYAMQTYLALGLIVAGISLATYGDYSCTSYGLFLTLLGSVLAAFKGIATNALLVGKLKLHPLDLLMKMSPLAFAQCLLLSFLTGEMGQIYDKTVSTGEMGGWVWASLTLNGLIAFGLNVVSFTGNKKTSALTMSVCGNIKQVLTILLSVAIFHLRIDGLNALGISITMAGGAYYSYVEYMAKHHKSISLPYYTPVPSSPALFGEEKKGERQS